MASQKKPSAKMRSCKDASTYVRVQKVERPRKNNFRFYFVHHKIPFVCDQAPSKISKRKDLNCSEPPLGFSRTINVQTSEQLLPKTKKTSNNSKILKTLHMSQTFCETSVSSQPSVRAIIPYKKPSTNHLKRIINLGNQSVSKCGTEIYKDLVNTLTDAKLSGKIQGTNSFGNCLQLVKRWKQLSHPIKFKSEHRERPVHVHPMFYRRIIPLYRAPPQKRLISCGFSTTAGLSDPNAYIIPCSEVGTCPQDCINPKIPEKWKKPPEVDKSTQNSTGDTCKMCGILIHKESEYQPISLIPYLRKSTVVEVNETDSSCSESSEDSENTKGKAVNWDYRRNDSSKVIGGALNKKRASYQFRRATDVIIPSAENTTETKNTKNKQNQKDFSYTNPISVKYSTNPESLQQSHSKILEKESNQEPIQCVKIPSESDTTILARIGEVIKEHQEKTKKRNESNFDGTNSGPSTRKKETSQAVIQVNLRPKKKKFLKSKIPKLKENINKPGTIPKSEVAFNKGRLSPKGKRTRIPIGNTRNKPNKPEKPNIKTQKHNFATPTVHHKTHKVEKDKESEEHDHYKHEHCLSPPELFKPDLSASKKSYSIFLKKLKRHIAQNSGLNSRTSNAELIGSQKGSEVIHQVNRHSQTQDFIHSKLRSSRQAENFSHKKNGHSSSPTHSLSPIPSQSTVPSPSPNFYSQTASTGSHFDYK